MQNTVMFVDGKVTTSEQLSLQANAKVWADIASTGYLAGTRSLLWAALAVRANGQVYVEMQPED